MHCAHCKQHVLCFKSQLKENLSFAKTDIAHCHHQLLLSEVNPVFLTPTSLQECFIPHCLLFKSRGSKRVEYFNKRQSFTLKFFSSHAEQKSQIFIITQHHPEENQCAAMPWLAAWRKTHLWTENYRTKNTSGRSQREQQMCAWNQGYRQKSLSLIGMMQSSLRGEEAFR